MQASLACFICGSGDGGHFERLSRVIFYETLFYTLFVRHKNKTLNKKNTKIICNNFDISSVLFTHNVQHFVRLPHHLCSEHGQTLSHIF